MKFSGAARERAVLFTDYRHDSDLTSGAELYTNSTQLGILQSKSRPPWCADVAIYNRMAFYGDIQTPWRLSLELFNMALDLTGVGAPQLSNIFRAYGATNGPVNGGQLTMTGGSAIVATVNDLRGFVGATITEGFGGPNYPGVSARLQAYSKIISATATTITLDKTATAPGVSVNSTLWPTFTVDGHDYYGTDRDNPGNFEFPYWIPIGALIVQEPSALYVMSKLAHLINITSVRVAAWVADEQFSAQDGAWRNLAKPRLDLEWRFYDTQTAPTFTYNLLDYGSGLTQAFEGQRTTPQLEQHIAFATSTGLIPTPFLRDAFEGGIGISAIDEPEAVPPLNYAPVGDQMKRIRRLIATTTALWAFKDDGLYRISGFDPSQIRIDLVDPTIRILRSEAADAGGQAIYVWTTQGVGILSDAGFQLLSKPIRDQLLPLEQGFAPYPTGVHGLQVVYDRVERRVFVLTPPDSGGKDASIAYVWSENTHAWTKWNIFSSAMCWDPATGKIRWSYVQSGARVLLTTHTRGSVAYTGDYPTAINISSATPGSGTTAIVLAAPATVHVNDGIVDSDGQPYRVSAVADTTHFTVVNDNAVVTPITGAATLYAYQSFDVAWQLRPDPSPFIQKVYRDTRAIFHDLVRLGSYTMLYRSFTSQVAPLSASAVVALPTVISPTDYLRRCGVRAASRAGNFDVEMQLQIACGTFSIRRWASRGKKDRRRFPDDRETTGSGDADAASAHTREPRGAGAEARRRGALPPERRVPAHDARRGADDRGAGALGWLGRWAADLQDEVRQRTDGRVGREGAEPRRRRCLLAGDRVVVAEWQHHRGVLLPPGERHHEGHDPGGALMPTDPYNDPYATDEGLNSFDTTSEGIPIWGDLSGANARKAKSREAAAAKLGMQEWGALKGHTDVDTSLPRSCHRYRGHAGSVAAYRGMNQMAGQAAAGQRAGIRQQAEARGMGASGAGYGAELQAGQAGADQAAQGGYQAVAASQKEKLQAAGEIAGVEQGNVRNRMDIAAGMTGQYSGQADRQARNARDSQDAQGGILSGIGAIIAAL